MNSLDSFACFFSFGCEDAGGGGGCCRAPVAEFAVAEELAIGEDFFTFSFAIDEDPFAFAGAELEDILGGAELGLGLDFSLIIMIE